MAEKFWKCCQCGTKVTDGVVYCQVCGCRLHQDADGRLRLKDESRWPAAFDTVVMEEQQNTDTIKDIRSAFIAGLAAMQDRGLDNIKEAWSAALRAEELLDALQDRMMNPYGTIVVNRPKVHADYPPIPVHKAEPPDTTAVCAICGADFTQHEAYGELGDVLTVLAKHNLDPGTSLGERAAALYKGQICPACYRCGKPLPGPEE